MGKISAYSMILSANYVFQQHCLLDIKTTNYSVTGLDIENVIFNQIGY